MDFQFDGLQEIMRRIESIGNNQQAKEKALDAGAEHFKRKLSANTVRSNINHQHAADNVVIDKEGNHREVGYDKDHYYMKFSEFGTSKMSPKPVISPTFENEVDKTEEAMAEVLRRELGL
ncbi:HK97-gp10 family putative phage morphogenesis protein [Rossellomorea sp. DA94]|uniref:HK97-gp10 family putative phage morphogenesis protein n=1 Tax=Rossellomorea sp. DA94 TaxID=3038653 RepID=UPI00244A3B3D|nr:HK97-gp10 family putative phage morphogenesis protein [Rossellomorea sp. DA94]WGG47684.1 HK97 gp10 family phage protein [Rossellomorea sp. DA94]